MLGVLKLSLMRDKIFYGIELGLYAKILIEGLNFLLF